MDINFAGNTIEEDTFSNDENLQVGIAADPAALAILLGNLSDLYPNRPRAVLQEGSQNALDAGGDRLPEITLPTASNPVLTIQDFGVGMSRKFMTSSYLEYGTSGKRGRKNADGTASRGGFGLGSKTPILVSDQYTVVSVYRNEQGELEKTGILFTKDSNGLAQPVRFDVDEAPDQTGTTVTIPMRDEVTEYVEQTWRTLATDLFCTFGDIIKVNGELPLKVTETMTALSDSVYIGTEKLTPYQNSRSASGDSGLYAVVGGISYPVNIFGNAGYPRSDSSIVDTLLFLAQRTDCKILVEAPVDGIEVPPARDQVKDTPKTRETLRKALEDGGNQFLNKVKADMAAAETPFEAISIWSKAKEVVDFRYMGHDVRPNPEFNGEELPLTLNLNPKAHRVLMKSRNSTNTRISNEDGQSVGVQYDGRYWKNRDRVVAVMGTNFSDSDVATAVKMLTRPYLLTEHEDEDSRITELMFFSEDKYSNAWLHLDPSDSEASTFKTISIGDFIEEGRTRKAAAAPAKARNTTRRKNTYAVYLATESEEQGTVLDNVQHLSMTDVRELEDEETPVAYCHGISRQDIQYMAGHYVAVLRETQSEEAFLKRVPKARPVKDVVNEALTARAASVDQDTVSQVARLEYLQNAYEEISRHSQQVASLLHFLEDQPNGLNSLKGCTHSVVEVLGTLAKIISEKEAIATTDIRDASALLYESKAGINRVFTAKSEFSDYDELPFLNEEQSFDLTQDLPLLKHGYSQYLNFRGAPDDHIVKYLRMALA